MKFIAYTEDLPDKVIKSVTYDEESSQFLILVFDDETSIFFEITENDDAEYDAYVPPTILSLLNNPENYLQLEAGIIDREEFDARQVIINDKCAEDIKEGELKLLAQLKKKYE